MPFHVFPDPQDTAQNIPSAGSHTFDIDQFTPKMFIRVALFAPSAAPAAPTLQVQAGVGDPVTVSVVQTNPIFRNPGTDPGDLVGEIGVLVPESDNVYAFTIDVSSGTTWKLTITNNDAS